MADSPALAALWKALDHEASASKIWNDHPFRPSLLLMIADALDESGRGDEAEGIHKMLEEGKEPDKWPRAYAYRLQDGKWEFVDVRRAFPYVYEWKMPIPYRSDAHLCHHLSEPIAKKMEGQAEGNPDFLGYSREDFGWICFSSPSGAVRAYARAYAAVKHSVSGVPNKKGT